MNAPTINSIDLTYRPSSYFWPLGLETHLLARIKGAERKAALQRMIDAGRLEVRRQPVDVAAQLRGQVTRLVAAGHDQSRFAVEVTEPLPEVWADPDRLEQILANLVENAVRHGDGGVLLSLRPDPDGDGVVVTVEDEGEGIAEEHLGMVFTKFWRGARRGGTGLGLYVVRGLVEAHDGRISVGRSSSGGARFRFTLPSSVPDYA